MKELLFVGLGGFLGSIGRYSVSLAFTTTGGWPFATFTVNLLGCLLIGLATGFFSHNYSLQLLFITGVLGGFTTFSSFGLETAALLKSGQTFLALAYALSSLILGSALAILGLTLTMKAST